MIAAHALMVGFCLWQASLHLTTPWWAVLFGFLAGGNAIQAWHGIEKRLALWP